MIKNQQEISTNKSKPAIESIEDQEFWIVRNRGRDSLLLLEDWKMRDLYIFVHFEKGEAIAAVSGKEYRIISPSMLLIRPGEHVVFSHVCDDIYVSICTFSLRLANAIVREIQKYSDLRLDRASTYVTVPPMLVPDFRRFYDELTRSVCDIRQPFYFQRLLFEFISFFFRTGVRCYTGLDTGSRDLSSLVISRKFLSLVHTYHQEERFLDFYAQKLGITTKHLSRTVKRHTDISAVEWIEHYVMIDAKMLLRSTDLSIKDISERLNVSSQSFFGKYFKKYVGMSPKEFRRLGKNQE